MFDVKQLIFKDNMKNMYLSLFNQYIPFKQTDKNNEENNEGENNVTEYVESTTYKRFNDLGVTIPHDNDGILTSTSASKFDSKETEFSHEGTIKHEENIEEFAEAIEEERTGGVLLVSLGGGEDQLFAIYAARLLVANNHKVTAVLYGPPPYEDQFPSEVKV